MPGSLEPRELAARLARGEAPVLLDVREGEELAICALPGVVHIPLGELTRRCEELDPAAELVCICHHGIRSARAAAFLERAGFARVWNLSGGVERWSCEVDPALPRY